MPICTTRADLQCVRGGYELFARKLIILWAQIVLTKVVKLIISQTIINSTSIPKNGMELANPRQEGRIQEGRTSA